MQNTKQDLLDRLLAESKVGINYSKKAIEFAKEGRIKTAWNMIDVAQCALTCTKRAHEELWNLTNGDLTEEEFEIFCNSETVTTVFNNALEEIKNAVKG